MKKCPKCGCQEFYVTNHVLQDWLVDGNGEYIQTEDSCVEVTHFADDADWWQCADCGYDATGMVFEAKEEEVKEMKKYTLKEWEKFCKDALIIPPFEDDEQLDEWFDTHKIHITANNCVMELEYDADAVNEIEFSLREIYNAIHGDGTATTGNTVGSEYRDATWKDILKFYVLNKCYNTSNLLKDWVQDCIRCFDRNEFVATMKEINNQTSINDELEVNFFKLDSTDLWKIFDREERRQAFKEILCSEIDIEELIDEDGRHGDRVVIWDYSIKPGGDMVGWHYGVDFDKNSDDNQYYIEKYIEEMISND